MADNLEEVGVAAVIGDLDAFLKGIKDMASGMINAGDAAQQSSFGIDVMAVAVGSFLADALMKGIELIGDFIVAMIDIGIEAFNIAKDVEVAFAGMAKTVDGMIDPVTMKITSFGEETLQAFRDVSKQTPILLEDLLGIGEVGGQFGVPAEAMAGFAETIAEISFAAVSIDAETAAEELAKIESIFNVAPEDFVEMTERLGSALIFLGNNTAASEGEILTISKRFAAAADLAGFTAEEVLGLGASVIATGVEAQAGGSSMAIAIKKIQTAVIEAGDDLDGFAEIAGTSAEDFSALWEEDASEAFGQFIAGIEAMGPSAIIALDDLGLGARNVSRTMLGLAGAGNAMQTNVENSTQAFIDNVALANEVAIQYSTLDSVIITTKNKFRDMALTVGTPVREAFKNALRDIAPFIDEMGIHLGPALEETVKRVQEDLIPALINLGEAFGLDLTGEGIKKGILDFIDKIPDVVDKITEFVDKITELVDAFKEGGTTGLLEELGITKETQTLIKQIGLGILIFLAALKTIGVVAVIGFGLLAGAATLAFIHTALAIPVAIAGLAALAIAAVLLWTTLVTGVIVAWALTNKETIVEFVETAIDKFKELPEKLRETLDEWIENWFQFWVDMGVITEEESANNEEIARQAGNDILAALWAGIVNFWEGTMLGGLLNIVAQIIDMFTLNFSFGANGVSVNGGGGGGGGIGGFSPTDVSTASSFDSFTSAPGQFVSGNSSGDNTNNDNSFNPVINASYANQQSPKSIAKDLHMLSLLERP